MSGDQRAGETVPELPRAQVVEKRRFPVIWLIPIVAAIAGAWLVYTTFASRGPLISITMQTASGIEPGKTAIRYRDVQLGVVDEVSLTNDLQRVTVRARMNKKAKTELREGTQFWIESARITAGGVSGLGTLLSGAYIGMRPGPGEPQRDFVGTGGATGLPGRRPGQAFRSAGGKAGLGIRRRADLLPRHSGRQRTRSRIGQERSAASAFSRSFRHLTTRSSGVRATSGTPVASMFRSAAQG